MKYNIKLVESKFYGSTNVKEEKMIKFAIKKSLQDLDEILSSKVGHTLVTFMLINENGQKFSDIELAPNNFKSFLKKLMQIQERILPQGSRVNQLLDFMGCTANICYI